jgi:hypothetical protein
MLTSVSLHNPCNPCNNERASTGEYAPCTGTPGKAAAVVQPDLQTAFAAWQLVAEAARRLLNVGGLRAVSALQTPLRRTVPRPAQLLAILNPVSSQATLELHPIKQPRAVSTGCFGQTVRLGAALSALGAELPDLLATRLPDDKPQPPPVSVPYGRLGVTVLSCCWIAETNHHCTSVMMQLSGRTDVLVSPVRSHAHGHGRVSGPR